MKIIFVPGKRNDEMPTTPVQANVLLIGNTMQYPVGESFAVVI